MKQEKDKLSYLENLGQSHWIITSKKQITITIAVRLSSTKFYSLFPL